MMRSKFDASSTSYADPRSCRGNTVSPACGGDGALEDADVRPPGADLCGAGRLRFDNSARGGGASKSPRRYPK